MFSFKSFQRRLFVWFLAFAQTGLLMAAVSAVFLYFWNDLRLKLDNVKEAETELYEAVEAQYKFFSYDTKSTEFYQASRPESIQDYRIRYLNEYRDHIRSCEGKLTRVNGIFNRDLRSLIELQTARVDSVKGIFNQIVGLLHDRGYRDNGLVSEMRAKAHWLEENARGISRSDLLYLRRHEKDFIIRNDTEYRELFFGKMQEIRSGLVGPDVSRVDSILAAYEKDFLRLVDLDLEVGVKDNRGLKGELDGIIHRAEQDFEVLVARANRWYQVQLWVAGGAYILLFLLVGLVSWVLSKRISRNITRPLVELTQHISRFVQSDFAYEGPAPQSKSSDEIAQLTQNFSVLKDEVIKWLRHFRQEVERQTRKLAEANTKLERVSEANRRFVPEEFLTQMGRQGIEDVQLGDHVAREMSVLFADIRDFTQLSESMSPEQNFEFINTYLRGIVPIIQEKGGFIDKFIGDTVMSLFPAAPDEAVRACFGMLEYLQEFNRQRNGGDIPEVRIGCGLHTGSLILGTIGHENRLETTVISDAVNTAARVESLTKHYGAPVLITGETLQALNSPEEFDYRFIDRLRVKGKQKWVEVYEFLPPWERSKRLYLQDYNEAVAVLRSGDVAGAHERLEPLYACYQDDRALERLKSRCAQHLNGDRKALEGMLKVEPNPTQ